MFDVNQASFCYPPQFPAQGRLPSRAGQVHQNIRLQSQQQRDYHDSWQAYYDKAREVNDVQI